MSIDEGIEKNRKIAETKKTLYDACILKEYNRHLLREYKEHEQLAELLEELKDYRDKNKMVVRVDVENMDSVKDKIDELSKYAEIQYNKAIDDFVKFANTMPTVEEEDGTIRPMWLEEIAEQLKAGVENENF